MAQRTLDYRNLKRFGLLFALPLFVVSAWVAALPLLLLATIYMGPAILTGGIAAVGILGVYAMLLPVIGIAFGLLGIMRAKSSVLRFFKAELLPPENPAVRIAHHFADCLGMPRPEVYVYLDKDINAWATGSSPQTAAVGLSLGAMQRLTRDELAAVIGHELGHIAAGDLRRMQFALSFQNTMALFTSAGLFKRTVRNTVGIVGELGVKGLSRRREYWADALGAVLMSPQTMQAALRKVHDAKSQPPSGRKRYNELMMRWSNGGVQFATHPTLDQRLAALDSREFYDTVLGRLTGNQAQASSRNLFTPDQAAATAALGIVIVAAAAWLGFSAWQQNAAPSNAPRVAGWVQRQNNDPTPEDIVRSMNLPDPMRLAGLQIPPPPVARPAPPPAAVTARAAVAPPKPKMKANDCFRLAEQQLPVGYKRTVDFEEMITYAQINATEQHKRLFVSFANQARDCLKKLGAKYASKLKLSKTEEVEIWYYAPEDRQCWVEPTAHKLGKNGLEIHGACVNPVD